MRKNGGESFVPPVPAEVRSHDLMNTETRRMLAVLDGQIEKMERMIPEGRTLKKMNAAQLAAVHLQMEAAAALSVQIDKRLQDSLEAGTPLVNEPSLSEPAQSVTLEKMLTLTEANEKTIERLKALKTRISPDEKGKA